MANELDCQRLVVKAVREHGGFGFKMSNRFLAGIPDLLIQHETLGTGLWEVKLDKYHPRQQVFKLKLTELQKKTLKDFAAAGGFCGVISFLKSQQELKMIALSYQVLEFGDHLIPPFTTHPSSYKVLPRGRREETIMSILKWAHNERHTRSKSQRYIGNEEG